jgi:hypothetical protein
MARKNTSSLRGGTRGAVGEDSGRAIRMDPIHRRGFAYVIKCAFVPGLSLECSLL